MADASVWIDLLQECPTLEAAQLERWLVEDDKRPLVMGDIILAEVLQGMADEKRAGLVESRLASLPLITICDGRIAVQAARYYRSLRSRGITIRKTIDTLIATRCIVDGIALLHRDRDFQPFVDHLGLIDAMTL